ncbi:class I SAM-dependent methyltransferase [Deltaproteobacteria bacterium TL4]
MIFIVYCQLNFDSRILPDFYSTAKFNLTNCQLLLPVFERCRKIARMKYSNISLCAERVESLSLESDSADVVIFSQSLHHLPRPDLGLKEAVRILKPEGKVLITELARHQEIWVLEKLGHAWPGFETKTLETMMKEAGLSSLFMELLPTSRAEIFQVVLASGVKII